MAFSDFADDFGVRDDLRQAEYKAKDVHDFAELALPIIFKTGVVDPEGFIGSYDRKDSSHNSGIVNDTNVVVAYFEVDEYKTNENYVSYQKEDLYEIYMGRIVLDSESPETVTMELKSQPYTGDPESIELLKSAGLIADNPEYGNGSEDHYIALKDTNLMIFIVEECRQTTLDGKDYLKSDQLPTAYSDPESRALSVQQLKADRVNYKQAKLDQRRQRTQATKARKAAGFPSKAASRYEYFAGVLDGKRR